MNTCKSLPALLLAAISLTSAASDHLDTQAVIDDPAADIGDLYVDVFRSLLINGKAGGVEDGVSRDDGKHSDRDFPFLAPPAP